MAAFRRCVIALAVLATLAGLASAQTATMTCNLSSLNTTIRAESKTDLVSDLLMTCTGGTINTASTTAAPTVNFTLTLPQAITSRILSTTGGLSEALLLIDDPGTSASGIVPNYGNNAAPVACTSAPIGCAAFPNVVGGVAVMSASAGGLGSPTTGAANTYQGVVSGNSVTFFGVPVIPPGSTASRTYRISNVRVDATAGSTGSLVGSIAVQGGAAPLFSLNQTQATLATVQSGQTVKSTGVSLSNCSAGTLAFAGTVSFTENFASGFRTRTAPGAGANSGQGNTLTQTVPGTYFTESGLETNSFLGSGGQVAGLADFGTRLKAVFNNIPSGVRVFVSFGNVQGSNAAGGVAGSVNATFFTAGAVTAAVGSNNTNTFAGLINGAETVGDSNTGAPLSTASVSSATVVLGGGAPTGTPYVELQVSGGSATAIWEVLNTNTAANETATFAVWVTYPAQQPTGQATVNASYAPLSGTTIPKFVDPNAASPQNSFSIVQCKTILLFPYVTAAGGFDTGIAIANTSTDIYGTTAQSGTCAITLYGHPTPVPTIPAAPFNTSSGTTGTVASGDVGSFALSQYASGFTGYAIAVCNFQYAHGFAFVADWTSTIQSSAMGYLALVLPGTTTRGLVSPVAGLNAESLTQ